MDIGLLLPSILEGFDATQVREWCRLIDEGPFQCLGVGDRIAHPNMDIQVLLGAAAVATERVRLVASILAVPMREAVTAAKQLATIDVLSGGRLTLGAGVGGHPEDYRAVGADWSTRYSTLDAQVRTIRRVWSGEVVTDGAPPVGPSPIQERGPAIFAGVLGPKAVEAASAWADGVCGFWFDPLPRRAKSLYARASEAWAEAGRPEPRRYASFWFALGPDGKDQARRFVDRYVGAFMPEMAPQIADTAVSSEAQLRDTLDGLRDAGCEEVHLFPTTTDPQEIGRLIDAIT